MGQTLEQASNNYQRDEILTDTTKTAYGLESTATPDDVFEILENSVLYKNLDFQLPSGENIPCAGITTGSYIANGGTMVTIPVPKTPKMCVLLKEPYYAYSTRSDSSSTNYSQQSTAVYWCFGASMCYIYSGRRGSDNSSHILNFSTTQTSLNVQEVINVTSGTDTSYLFNTSGTTIYYAIIY